MKRVLSIVLFLAATIQFSTAQRVVGYYPNWKSVSDVNNIQWGKITDIVYAFAITDGSGNLTIQNTTLFNAVVSAAQTNGVKVHLSIGGAGQSGNFGTVSNSSGTRTTFANNLANLVQTHDLDGVDLDWEFPSSGQTTNFTNLASAIRTALDAKEGPMGKTLEFSAAVSPVQYNNSAITSAVFTTIDYFNIMAYDDDRGIHGTNHSAYAFATESINYWSTTKGLSKSKMRLGVPFYGRTSGGIGEAYNVLGASAPSTAYNADSYNGYYYNGKTTIESKSQLVLNEGLDGIMIWELSQDRSDQYSLLNAIDGILDAGTPCENPNLGFDKSLCDNPSVTLDPNVSQGNPDFTFSWTKDAGSLGLTTETINATSAGEYCVTYTHQSGSCPEKSACVDVIDAEAVNTQDGSRCGTGTVDLSILDAGTYKWFDSETNGSQLAIGTSYTTPSISSTTTYWVEKPAVSETVGMAYNSTTVAIDYGTGDGSNSNGSYLKFDALSDFTIDQITIYHTAGVASNLTLKLYDGTDSEIDSKTFSSLAPGKQTLDVGFPLTTGSNYKLEITGSTIWIEKRTFGNNVGYPFETTGIISFTNTYAPPPDDLEVTNWYLGLFDWQVSAGGSCGRVPVVATILTDCTPPVVNFNSPSNGGSQTGMANVSLSADATDSDGTVSSVTFNVYEGSNPTPVATLIGSQSSNTFTATWTPTVDGNYTIEAVATDDDNNQATASITYTINAVTSISNPSNESILVYPNPSITSFNIASGSTVNYNIKDLNGRILESGSSKNQIGRTLPAGTYILNIVTEQQSSNIRIVKQ